MEYLFPILIVIAMFATLGVLGFGLITMVRGGSPGRANKIMQSRVLLQGVALILFAVFMLLFRR